MPPRMRENVNQKSGEFLSNQEESHAQKLEQSIVEKLGQKYDMHTAGIRAAYAHISNRLVEELTATRIEEISQIMSKVVADYLKTLLSKPNQSTPGKHDSDKEASKESNQPKKIKESPGSSKAGDVHRLISVLPRLDKEYTPPQKRKNVHAEWNQSNVQGDSNENNKSPVNHVHVVTIPLHKHASYKDVTSSDLQRVNVGANTRGAQPSKEYLEEKDHLLSGNDKKLNQGGNQPKKVEKCSRSSKAGVIHRPIPILPNRDKWSTPPPRNANQVHMVNNPLYEPVDFEDEVDHCSQEVNTGVKARGAQTSKKESKEKCYCKYHNSFNHATKVCRTFKTMLQEKTNKRICKFPKERKIRKCWVPRGQMFEVSARYNETRTKSFQHNHSRDDGESAAFGPRYQHFSIRTVSAKNSSWLSGDSSQQRHEKHQFNESSCFEFQKAKDVIMIFDGGQMDRVPLERAYKQQTGRSRFVLPPRKDFDGTWRVAQHRKFSKPVTETQKKRLLRERVATRMEEPGKLESKLKLGLSVTEGNSSDGDNDLLSEENVKEQKTFDLCVGKFHISVDHATRVGILPEKFKMRERKTRELVPKEPAQGESQANKLPEESLEVIIRESHLNKPNLMVLEKSTPTITKHIRPLYMKAHVNGKSVSSVLIDNGSTLNVMPVKILKSLSKTEEDLIPTKVSVAAFAGETTKTIGVFPANVTLGNWPLGHFAYMLMLMSMFLLVNSVKIMEKVGSVANVFILFFIICAVIIHEVGLRAT